jgi:hypothetical protein
MKRLIITLIVLGLLAVGIPIPVSAYEPMGSCPPDSPGMHWELKYREPGTGMDRNGDGCVCRGYRQLPGDPPRPPFLLPPLPIIPRTVDNNLPPG